ncbi:MAG TPA: hypothetical protein VMH35_11760 [Streptosporangiaceae bacterium]|nr:hypothetical protein [Streptosporangiaceae bacterium]
MVTGWPAQPVIYEINTAVWLDALSRAAGRRITLADVPGADWDEITPAGVDAVWLMGVWERSPAGRALARADRRLAESFRAALPDLGRADVIGSPYSVRRYVADAAFGGSGGLAAARDALAARGIRLVLDYVPNHVAADHPWVSRRPDYFVQGGPDDVAADPAGWLAIGGHVLAHGRDPYFPPWTDVVQLNAFAPALRAAAADTLASIAAQCDGIRCDMAMLLASDVFARTWGRHAGPRPDQEFWPGVLTALRATHPSVVLIAEAYWDMEPLLLEQGFDFCYDKGLYDRIVSGDATAVRDHLRAGLSYQSRLLRFVENHDEPRIATLMATDAERAAAVTMATLPGATLWHEGQFEGRRVRPPVQLARRLSEPLDARLAGWYRQLLAGVQAGHVRAGGWRLIEPSGWPDNQSGRNLLAWAWDGDQGGDRHLVVVNLSGQPAQGLVPLGWPDLPGRDWELASILGPEVFQRAGAELAWPGLYVVLEPWQFHLLAVR